MKPQLTIPNKGNPYYNTKDVGGYNPCIKGNPSRRVSGLNVLPNCVGYCVSRYNELGNYGYCKWLGNTNAKNFVNLAKKQGLTVTTEPTLGGVMVWSGGSYGHVASVEVITSKDIVITSESEYFGKPFATYTRKKGDGNWRTGCYWMGKAYKYIGCIKNPAIMTYEEVVQLIQTMFPSLFQSAMTSYEAELRSLPADAYAEAALAWAKEQGIMVGDTTGNQMPQSKVKREDLAVILKALDK